MGWGINIKNVELRRVTKDNLRDQLEEREETIRHIREKILMLVASSPDTVPDSEGHPITWVEWIHGEVNSELSEYETAVWERNLIQCAIDFPEDVESF